MGSILGVMTTTDIDLLDVITGWIQTQQHGACASPGRDTVGQGPR